MLNRQAKQGEGGQAPHTQRMKIYLAELGEKADSSVQGGTRPVIVLQNNAGNRSSPTVIVAPIIINTKMSKVRINTIGIFLTFLFCFILHIILLSSKIA